MRPMSAARATDQVPINPSQIAVNTIIQCVFAESLVGKHTLEWALINQSHATTYVLRKTETKIIYKNIQVTFAVLVLNPALPLLVKNNNPVVR